MSATLAVRHTVADFATWRTAYDQVGALRAQHGCTADQVFQTPGDPNDVFVTHEFPTLEQATAFVNDPALGAAMQAAGVVAAPRIEIFERA